MHAPPPVEFQQETENDVSVGQIVAMMRRRAKLITIVALVTIAIVVGGSFLVPKKWTAEAQLVLQEHPAGSNDPGEQYASAVSDNADTNTAMLDSDAGTVRALDWIDNNDEAHDLYHKLEPNETFDDFQKDIKIDNPKDTDTINIMADGVSPKEAYFKAEAVTESFTNWKTEIARHNVELTILSLQQRADRSHDQLAIAEQALTAFKASHQLLDSTTQDKVVLDRIAQAQADIDAGQQDLKSQTARLATYQAQLNQANKAIVGTNVIRDDELLQSLQTQLNDAELKLTDLKSRYTSAYPGKLAPTEATIADLKQRIADRVKQTISINNPSLAMQSGLLDSYNKTYADVSFTKAKLAAAQSQVAALKQTLAQQPTDRQSVRSVVPKRQRLEQPLYLSSRSRRCRQARPRQDQQRCRRVRRPGHAGRDGAVVPDP